MVGHHDGGSRQAGSALLEQEQARATSDAPSRAGAARATAAARWATGVLCILVVALIWSFASVLVQFIFLDAGFFRPFFLTYVANSLFVVNLPIWRAAMWLGCTTDPHARDPAEPETAADLADEDVRGVGEQSAARGDAAATGADEDATASDGAPVALGSAPSRAKAAVERLARWAETGSLKPPAARRRRVFARLQSSTPLSSAAAAAASSSSRASEPSSLPLARGRVPYAAVLRIALLICPIWFGANLAYITSLALTSVTSSTIISTTSSLFTFGLSVLVLDEQPSAAKVAGVSLCMAGNVLTALADRAAPAGGVRAEHAFLGDAVCLLGAMLYGLYTVLIRRLMPDEERFSLALFFGLLGAANGAALLPVVVALHLSGVEPLGGLNARLVGMILVKGLLDNVLSDFLWAKAIMLTSPTAATVGLSLTIPIAMATDAALHGIHPSGLGSLAALLVCAGFVMINAASSDSCACARSGSPCAAGGAAAALRRVARGLQRPRARRDEPLYAVVNAGAGTGIVRGVAASNP